ncbi:MAG: M20/M25/M40 family metallo-hydrolase [Bacteroidales bacterium]|nr:M20/M25/M40 family metallo-hydrolase [Bacteroidales bacterium]MCF8351117.1 M20/M25/M40 family metallo-hydrolase [Bacteroidales bacterium]MCF8374821.1 M20/M25/M40 family metallo-hydrolase [Bacteroidales bacterium]MCF8399775.1 M20/M25/M40 family metallo-hydrolase [Bacteroidales bacterium]
MKRYILPFLFMFLSGQVILAQEQPEITVEELKEHVEFLASDELKGRKAGSEEGLKAARFIREKFEEAGLQLLADEGFQYFDLVVDVIPGNDNFMIIGDSTYNYKEDYSVYAFSKNAELEAPVVFAGYGMQIDKDDFKWNDYEGVDAEGKWVMVLKGDPKPEEEEDEFINYSSDRAKVLAARDHGAAGVILVSGPAFDEEDRLVSLRFDKTGSEGGIPVVNAKRYIGDYVLASANTDIATLESKINGEMKSFSFDLPLKATIKTDIQKKVVQDQNVVAMVDAGYSDCYIVLGAHYDHLGMGGPGSGSRMPDTSAAHNGADDNASGLSGMIEIAEKLNAHKDQLACNVIVAAFGAEEMGLIGSAYLVSNPIVPLEKMKAMINFDMIGRLDDDQKKLSISGTGTAAEFEALLDTYQQSGAYSFSYSPEGFGPSDHAAFYAADIPVLFITTGAHKDYHTPFDDVEYLNFKGMKEVAEFAYALTLDLATADRQLSFEEAGPKRRVGYRNKLKVTLGIMPDFTSSEQNGLGVGGVTPGRPADKAGMQKGDLIVAINGKSINNIYDYMNRLKQLEPGQIITVDLLRDGEPKVLIVQLD